MSSLPSKKLTPVGQKADSRRASDAPLRTTHRLCWHAQVTRNESSPWHRWCLTKWEPLGISNLNSLPLRWEQRSTEMLHIVLKWSQFPLVSSSNSKISLFWLQTELDSVRNTRKAEKSFGLCGIKRKYSICSFAPDGLWCETCLSYRCRRHWWPKVTQNFDPTGVCGKPSRQIFQGNGAPALVARNNWNSRGNKSPRWPRCACVSTPFSPSALWAGGPSRRQRISTRTEWRWPARGTFWRLPSAQLSSFWHRVESGEPVFGYTEMPDRHKWL